MLRQDDGIGDDNVKDKMSREQRQSGNQRHGQQRIRDRI